MTDFYELVVAARNGDEDAFRVLFRSVQPSLLRYLRTMASGLSSCAADDIAAETWLRVVSGLGRFDGDEAGFRAWVFTIARARLTDARRRARHLPLPAGGWELDTRAAPDTADLAVELVSTEHALRLIGALPPSQAEAVLLRHVAGLDVGQTARVMGKTPGAVRVTTLRGLRKLEQLLGTGVDPRAVTGPDGRAVRYLT